MLLVFVLFFSLLESVISINAVVSVQLAFLVFSSPKTKIGTDFYRILAQNG
jgi:CRISPR/Cas system endoribonuclease Cas6 (RAMP superfamily)